MIIEGAESLVLPKVLPILPLRKTVMFPLTAQALIAAKPASIALIDEAVERGGLVGLVAQFDDNEEPDPHSLPLVGTLARIARMNKKEDKVQLIVQGAERIRIEGWLSFEPYLTARASKLPDVLAPDGDIETEALLRNLSAQFLRFLRIVPLLSKEELFNSHRSFDALQLAYTVASILPLSAEEGQELLELDPLSEKLRRISKRLAHEIEVLELETKISSEAQSEMGKSQREYILREQLKAIQRELGEDSEVSRADEFREKIEKLGMPEEAKRETLRELERLEKIQSASPEYAMVETYLDWMTSLPWNASTEDHLDIKRARDVLEADHYGLSRVKERILEYLGVRKLRDERGAQTEEKDAAGALAADETRSGTILCFVGPPGVGKTSLGQSIGRALGRKFSRLSLGGMRDEAEIRGHRKTYIGAMPGRIIQAIRRAESKNPVLMLDEVDKIGASWQGDPASALLEVLDPAQNRDFRDHYLGVPFDLSEVIFITTANVLDTIPGPLRDRMEVLELAGYTEDEKAHIAERYLLPRQIHENGLREGEVKISRESLLLLIRDYTREAGVRELERQIGTICRKLAAQIAEDGTPASEVTPERIRELLGKAKYFLETAERTELPGVAIGLAMTAAGGDILFIEVTKMPGRKGFVMTGQLGDVMKESAQAALSYVRGQSEMLGFDRNFFNRNDIHVHVPAGAIPKDGPSAGITIATALASLLTERSVRSSVGMTGELTLRGQVLPVGGIKEKVLAAHRAGLKTVILPLRNEKDLEDVPANVLADLEFLFVDRIDDVFTHALEPHAEPIHYGNRKVAHL